MMVQKKIHNIFNKPMASPKMKKDIDATTRHPEIATSIRKAVVFGNPPKIGISTKHEPMSKIGVLANDDHMPITFRNSGLRATGHSRSLYSISSVCHSVSSAESEASLASSGDDIHEHRDCCNDIGITDSVLANETISHANRLQCNGIGIADSVLNDETISHADVHHCNGICIGDSELSDEALSHTGTHCSSDTTASSEGIVDELEDLVITVQSHVTELKLFQEQYNTFEDSYCNSKLAVRELAQDLVMKIREHEKRLMDEIETRYETTHKKIKWSRKCIDDTLGSMEKLSDEGHFKVREILKHHLNVESQHQIIEKIKNEIEKESEILENIDTKIIPITVNPVRCNTSFAILDRTPCCSCTTANANQRRKSITASPLHLSKSFAGRNRTGSLQTTGLGLGPRITSENNFDRRFSLQTKSTRRSLRLIKSPSFHNGPYNSLQEDTTRGMTLLWQIKTEGDKPGELNIPNDVLFLPDGDLVVSDRENKRLQVFSKEGVFKRVIGEKKIKPRRIAYTKDGNIAVTCCQDNVVKVFTPDGALVNTWGKKRFKTYFKAICGLATMKKNYIVSDMNSHAINLYTYEGKCLKQVNNDIELNSSTYIATNKENQIFISQNWNHLIRVFDSEGEFLFQFDKSDDERSPLRYPNGISFDAAGNIYIADWGHSYLRVFTKDGYFIENLLTDVRDGLNRPAGVAIQGNLLAITEYSDEHSAVKLYRMDDV